MPKRFYEKDGDLSLLKNKTIAIVGYGSQGHAHALNLRDSGLDVVVGLHDGSASRVKAESAGLRVLPTGEAAKAGNVIMSLFPIISRRISIAKSWSRIWLRERP